MKKINVATVFSGIGSIEFALKRLKIDHTIMFACDNGERDVRYDKNDNFNKILSLSSPLDKMKYVDGLYSSLTHKKNYVQETYLSNYTIKNNLFFQDICLLDGKDFNGKIDLFVGGSPCQSFSSVGSKNGLDDTRGTLFYEFARLIKEIQPKVFIYENVRNLLKHDNGKTWDIIKKTFDSLGYNYSFEVLNSCDFGIPQNRRRLFVVGFKNNVDFVFPVKQKLLYDLKDFTINNCSFGNFLSDSTGDIKIINKKGNVEQKYFLSPLVFKYVMSGGTKKFYQKPEINKKIARTLLKTMGNKHRAGIDNYISFDGTENLGSVRMLTEREALRLMGYTDDFIMPVSKSQAYKQAGNSIVVDVMINILKSIINTGVFD